MDDADFSEDTTSREQEDQPHDGDFPHVKAYQNYDVTAKGDISNQMTLTVGDLQEKATHSNSQDNSQDTYSNSQEVLTMDEVTENAIDQKPDKENQHTTNLHTPTNKRASSKSNISHILLHHLSTEEFLKGKGISGETLPEISNVNSFDDSIIKNSILHYVKNSWPKDLTNQLNPRKDEENTSKLYWYSTRTEENTCHLEEPVATGDGRYQEHPNFLTNTKSLSDKQISCKEQAPQKQDTEKADLDNGFQYGQGQGHCQFSGFSRVVPKVSIPKNNIIDRPFTLDKQTSSSKLRDESATVQCMLQALSRSNFVEKQERERKAAELLQQTQMGPTRHTHQECLAGTEVEMDVFKLSTSHKDPSSNSSCIFQKLSQGNQMCQKLTEQTDKLKSKVQAFAKSIAQESPHPLQDRRLILKNLQGHLEFLKQEFLATKERHQTSQQQAYKHDSPALSDFDPERKVEGEIFKLEMLLGDVKEKIDGGKCTSALSLSMSSPLVLHDLASSPSSNEEDPNNASPRQDRAETTSPRCAFCHRVLEWQQKMEGKGHRRISCGRSPTTIHEEALHPDSILGSDRGHSCHSASGPRLQNNACEGHDTTPSAPQRLCTSKASHEFLYRYNTPGQSDLNHSARCAFAQLCSLNDNKNSSPSCSEPKWICSLRANSKSSLDDEFISGKKNLKSTMTCSLNPAASSPHFHLGRISGGKSFHNISHTEEMESQILNTSLDRALRTATTLKETTNRMIKTISEDLAKVKRWRSQLKY